MREPAAAEPAGVPPGYDALGEAKRLLRTIRSGALATLDPSGAPFASLVSVATLPEGSPLLLLSGLAAHTRHLLADGRCSLLLAVVGKGDPLAHPRLTLTGAATQVEADARPLARRRLLARHPKAALYVDFPDFGFWRLTIAAAHLNGGFARAAGFAGDALLAPPDASAALAEVETGALDHMNADHTDALRLYGEVLARAGDGPWRATGLDPEGIDLACGDRTARVPFDAPVASPTSLRAALVALAERARTATTAVPHLPQV